MRFASAVLAAALLPAFVHAQSGLFDGKPSPADRAVVAAKSAEAPPPHPQWRAAQAVNALAFRLLAGGADLGPNGLFAPLGYARADELAAAALNKKAVEMDLGKLVRYLADAINADGGPPRLELLSAVWTRQPSLPEAAGETLGAELRTIDTASRAQATEALNTWFAQSTRDAVRKVVDGVALASRPAVVVTDAAVLRTEWLTPFDPAETKPAAFTSTDGQAADVPTMRTVANVGYLKNADVELVVLPLSPEPADVDAPSLAVVLMLPPAGSDVAKLRGALTAERFAGWLKQAIVTKAGLEAWEKTRPDTDLEVVLEKWIETYPLKAVTIAVPRFELRSSGKPPAGWAFAPAGGSGLFAQACVLKVTESGVNADAVRRPELTGGVIGRPATFTADRPFLVTVIDQTSGAVLLAGQVDRP